MISKKAGFREAFSEALAAECGGVVEACEFAMLSSRDMVALYLVYVKGLNCKEASMMIKNTKTGGHISLERFRQLHMHALREMRYILRKEFKFDWESIHGVE